MSLEKLTIEFLPNFNQQVPFFLIREENGEVITKFCQIADYYARGSFPWREEKNSMKKPIDQCSLSYILREEFTGKQFKEQPDRQEIVNMVHLSPFSMCIVDTPSSIECHPLDFLEGSIGGNYSVSGLAGFFERIRRLHKKRDEFISRFNLRHTACEVPAMLKEGLSIVFSELESLFGKYVNKKGYPKHSVEIEYGLSEEVRRITLVHELVHAQLARNNWRMKKYLNDEKYHDFVEYCVEYETTLLLHQEPGMLLPFQGVLEANEKDRVYLLGQ